MEKILLVVQVLDEVKQSEQCKELAVCREVGACSVSSFICLIGMLGVSILLGNDKSYLMSLEIIT
jgi:hypothetical protein